MDSCSGESPFNLKQFDFTAAVSTDLSEFHDFYSESQFREIERPQNPFHKNFSSYGQAINDL